MGGLFGGGYKAKPQFTGLAVQTSTNAVPISLCWGQNRLPPNIIWQGDFKSRKHKQGKGGGKSATTYTYSASFQMGLCWGEINAIVAVWKDQSKVNLSGSSGGSKTPISKTLAPAYNFFLGTTPQDPWGYLTSAHPDEALGYPGIAHVDIANYDLGESNSLGQHSFEVQALRWNTCKGGASGALDADPALIVEDFLNDPGFGVGFNMGVVSNLYSTGDATTTGDSAYQTYCRAMGFGLSPFLTSQETAGDIIDRWAKITNTALVWNGYSWKFHPRGPDVVTGNGVTYIPDFEVRYHLTDDDLIAGDSEDPIRANRVDPADAPNSLSLIIANRANEYNDLPVPWRDRGLVDQYGLRKGNNLDAKEITEIAMAEAVVALIGQRDAYVRNSYEIVLPGKYCRLEPMDILQLTDTKLGVLTVLITTIDESEDDTYSVVAEEYFESVSTPSSNSAQGVTNTPKNTAASSGPSNPPVIFEPPSSLTGGTPQVWVAVSGGDGTTADPNWGGALVWISTDNISFVQVGTVTDASRMGKLTSTLATYGGTNPDASHTLAVSLAMSAGELEDEASAFDAENGSNLCYVGGEYISFEVPTLTGSYAYNLTDLWRGMYGSTIGSHSSGSDFVYIDDALFKYVLPPEYINKTLYFKFQSQNIFELTSEDLADVDTYTYTPSGAGFGTGADGVPSAPTGVTGVGGAGFARVSWAKNPVNDSVSSYKVYRATGASQAFSSATTIATVSSSSLEYVDVTGAADQPYTYFVVAVNAAGHSIESTGVNITPLPSASLNIWRVAGTGTGSSQNVTLPYPDVDENGVFVYVNGVRYETDEYSISGTNLTITTNANGDSIEIIGIVTS